MPVGKHPFQLYSLATPNGQKVSIMFEELLEKGHDDAEYDAWPIRIGEGDQFGSGFVDINPNSKIPALVDRSGPEPVRVFEIRRDPRLSRREVRRVPAIIRPRARRDAVLAVLADGQRALPRWRLRPLLRLRADEDRISDQSLCDGSQAPARRSQPPAGASNEYIAGPDYTIADIAIWPWYGGVALGRSYPGADEFLATHEYEHVMRWAKQIDARPAVKRGRIVNKLTGDPSEQLHERHDASDFELRTEDKIERTPALEDLAAVKDDAI